MRKIIDIQPSNPTAFPVALRSYEHALVAGRGTAWDGRALAVRRMR
jgi:hypothetical protein